MKLVSVLAACLAAMVIVACDDDPQDGCPEGLVECEDQECRTCCANNDCLEKVNDCDQDDIICNQDHECECTCFEVEASCVGDLGGCCRGLACDVFTNTCVAECTADADCASRTEIPFTDDLVCRNGLCDFMHCTQDADCAGGKACYKGDCVTIPLCDQIEECVVLPPSAVIRQGTTAKFTTAPYMKSGAVAPGFEMVWSSSDTGVATVEDGLVTGGPNTGRAEIAAVVGGCEGIRCTAAVLNYGENSSGTRVVVSDDLEGFPVEGATVEVGTETAFTDEFGVATLASELTPADPQDVTVLKRGHHYQTLRGVSSSDVFIQIGRVYQLDYSVDPPSEVAGGIKGKFDFTKVEREEERVFGILMSFAGLSLPGNLFDLDTELFIGEQLMERIELGGSEDDVLIPSGVMQCLSSQYCFKEFYHNTAVPGKRIAWGISGKYDLSSIMSIKLIGEQRHLLVASVSDFKARHSTVVPNVEVVSRPKVIDFDDINGNTEETECCCPSLCGLEGFCHPLACECTNRPEGVGFSHCPDMVADYDNYHLLDMAADVAADQPMMIVVPPFAEKEGGGYYYDAVLIIAGVKVNGAGFVPLGIAAGADRMWENEAYDGLIEEPIELKVAPIAGRIPEGNFQRLLLAVALNYPDFNSSYPDTEYVAGQVLFVDSFSETVGLNEFMTPATISYDSESRILEVTSVPADADYAQASFFDQSGFGRWKVLGDSWEGSYDLPDAPRFGDRSSRVSFVAVDLKDGVGYQDLVAFNNNNMDGLFELVKGFVFVDDPINPTCGDCSTGGTGGILMVFLLLGLARLRFSGRVR